MSTVVVKRSPRMPGPEAPEDQIELAEPPILPEPPTADLGSVMVFLPMLLGVGAMVMMFSLGARSTTTYMMSGMMGVAMISMGLGQLGRRGADRKRKMRSERRDYLRYLAQVRRRVRQSAAEQRAAAQWDNPHPRDLLTMAGQPRLWERRAGHEDFADVRIGQGSRRANLVLVPPGTKPVEDLEPLSAISLRRFTNAHQSVAHLPVTLPLRRFTSVELAGEGAAALGLLRALIGQLAVLHSPDELRIALLSDAAGRADWGWLKWLPHNLHPFEEDVTGPLRLVAEDLDTLFNLLGDELTDRPDHEPDAPPRIGEPFIVVLAYRVNIPDTSRLLGAGVRNVVLLDATGAMTGGPHVLRLTLQDGNVQFPAGDALVTAKADSLSSSAAESLARVLAPLRTSGGVDLVDQPLETDFDLSTLLGIRDPRSFDVAALWRTRSPQNSRLRVPIGITAENEVLELDLKESAQAGMGPHGLLIGATGSGKSELVRTLVMGLAATHSSDVLNFVLVDFKGGATFLNMDRLPHTSAVITNLADELHLVDRMRDSLNGEMMRRQELLRESGYSSLFEYEKARLGGTPLAPLPSLLVVVDEFSELLANKPEFIDLFVSIGRLGRSLGVHLLLASQRLDEGRIHRVEGHLSYRIALRTFSSMESRSVIGVGSAYELPSAPGNGYLKIDTSNLARFKAAYVSGACPTSPIASGGPSETMQGRDEIVPFAMEQRLPASTEEPEQTGDIALPEPTTQTTEPASDDEESLLEVLVGRLEGAGPPARQVWLPPLDVPATVDQLLPGIVPDPERGMSASDFPALGKLRVPIGMVDRPFEQLRELLVADLSGADGHMALAGAPQTGKSTMLRTLMLALALTHTPREVQFYCLDFGGGGLQSVAGLPHVGSIATRLDRDRVQRTLEELTQLLEVRERRFTELGLESIAAYRARRDSGEIDDPYGDVFLVIDNWGTLKQDFEDLEPRITDLAARGLSFGLHVIVSAVRWSEIRPRARDLFGTKFELRLGDGGESEHGSRVANTVPHQPGRGLTSAKLHFLCALPRLDSSPASDDLTAATRAAVAEIDTFWTGRSAPGVRLLPTNLPLSKLPDPDGDLRVALGWDEQRLAPVWHDFGTTPHLLVFGDSETGKTNVLRLAIDGITRRFTPGEARILLADTRRDLLSAVPEEYRVAFAVDGDSLTQLAGSAAVSVGKRVPGADIAPERLARRDWWTGPRLFVLVDDYDLYGGGPGMGSQSPLSALAPMLAHSVNIGLHLVISRSTSGASRAMMDPVLRRIWELGSPALLHSYPKEEGKFIGEARPRTLPPGRAQLVTRRGIRLIQVGYAAP
ncbi:type VII secretion protein EccCa [Streptomyces sp. NPDC048663]|uniref:type VII secretion protein EccCa n=1 Tax=Streptomyces sp. NPDC048663 TaxID=3155638 RepID=UPI003421CE54